MKKIKYGKIFIVVFLTVLIWIVADLAKSERYSVPRAVITIAKSADPSLWVSFDKKSSVSIDNILFKGPASKIARLKRQLNQSDTPLKFSLNPVAEDMTIVSEGSYPLSVLNFLRQTDQIKELGLTVESCSPPTIVVSVVKLVEKSLNVECVNEKGTVLKTETIDPPKVSMFVPQDWTLNTTVKLNPTEKDQAKSSVIEKIPYVELGPGQIRYASTPVKVKILPDIRQLSDSTIIPTLGITLSPNLPGQYEVKITNLNAVISPVTIQATSAAKQAYEDQPFQIILYILDDDEEQRREVVYNFPQEFLRSNEIKLKGSPVVAQFRLVPLASTESRPAVEQ